MFPWKFDQCEKSFRMKAFLLLYNLKVQSPLFEGSTELESNTLNPNCWKIQSHHRRLPCFYLQIFFMHMIWKKYKGVRERYFEPKLVENSVPSQKKRINRDKSFISQSGKVTLVPSVKGAFMPFNVHKEKILSDRIYPVFLMPSLFLVSSCQKGTKNDQWGTSDSTQDLGDFPFSSFYPCYPCDRNRIKIL